MTHDTHTDLTIGEEFSHLLELSHELQRDVRHRAVELVFHLSREGTPEARARWAALYALDILAGALALAAHVPELDVAGELRSTLSFHRDELVGTLEPRHESMLRAQLRALELLLESRRLTLAVVSN